jgi:endonuclease-8
MPEGDTVHLAATRLDAALGGKPLTRFDLRVPRYATAELTGRTVEEVVARGKHLLFRIEDGVTLHTHFKMEGSWHLYKHGTPWRGPSFQVRAVLENADWVAVGFRLAIVDLIPTVQEDEVVGHLGPDLLGPDWDEGRALSNLLEDPSRPIGDALIDQRNLAGLGNVYKSEICFLRGLDPTTTIAHVEDLPGLVATAKRVIEANRSTGRQITTGDTRPGRTHWVYGRGGEECRRCGTAIEKEMQGERGTERVTYWCRQCQRLQVHHGG